MAKALFAEPEKKIVLEDIDLPELGKSQVRVRTAFSFISAGTELTQLQMGKPNVVQPVTKSQIGYSLAGVVTETGSDVTHVRAGERVCCVGEGAFHATEVSVAKNLVVPIPEAVSLREAAPAAMMCFALEGVRKAKLEFGENVLVVGGGAMGQIVSQYALGAGCQVFLVDQNQHRLDKAPENVRKIIPDEKGWSRIISETAPVGIEAAIMCLGGNVSELFNQVKKVMSKSPDDIAQGRVVFSGGATITVQLASASGNLRILSSAKAGPGYRDIRYEAGGDYPLGYVKWTVTRNMKVILDAIARKQLSIENLITHEYPFHEAMTAYAKLAEPNTDALMILLKY